MSQENEWWYADDTQKFGPYTLQQVQAFIAAGTVKVSTLVWRPGLAGWVKVQQCGELFAEVSPPSVETDEARNWYDFYWYWDVLRRWQQFNGRSSRKAYWLFVLQNTIISFGIGVVSGLIELGSGPNPMIGFSLGTLYNLLILIPSFAVATRRLHDTGRSGWWILVPVVSFVFLCFKSQEGDNEYGTDTRRRRAG
jgi:uncharacterized membrane protein YhaH (DUF805 family)